MQAKVAPIRVALWGRPRIARWLSVVWAVSYLVVESAAAVETDGLVHLVLGVPLLFLWWAQLIVIGWRAKTEDFQKPRAFWIAWGVLPSLCLLLVGVTQLGAPRYARFKLSEHSLTTYATSVLEGGLPFARDVGLFRAIQTSVVDERVYIVTHIRPQGVSGVVYSSEGPPSPDVRLLDGHAYDLAFTPASDGWWYFEQHRRYT